MTHDPSVQSSLSPELIALQRVVAGRYSIVRELGRGGMGIVFLARDDIEARLQANAEVRRLLRPDVP